MSKNRLLWLIILLIAVKTILFTVLLPPWQGPDEPFHFKMGYVVADPSSDVQKLDSELVESFQRYRFHELSDYTQKNDKILELSSSKLPGYYKILAFLFKPFSGFTLTGKMFLGRFFSAVGYLIIIFLVYRISRRVIAGDEGRWLSVAAVSFVGFQPQYSFFSITLNSDNLIILLLTIILYCVTFVAARERDVPESGMRKYWPWAIAILTVLVVLLVKRTGIVGLLLLCLCTPIVAHKHRRSLMKAGSVSVAFLALLAFMVFLSGFEAEKRTEDLNQYTINFKGIPGDIRVSYQAFDMDSDYEVAVLLNGNEVGYVKQTKDNEWSSIRSVILPDEFVADDSSNVLTFDNVCNPPHSHSWGVRNVQIADVLEVKEPHGNIPDSKMIEDFPSEKRGSVAKGREPSTISKWLVGTEKAAREGFVKLSHAFDVPPHLIVRFILVQFVSFWFSMGWMIYKMSLGWYVLFSLITLLSFVGVFRLMYERIRNRSFEFVNVRVVALLMLLVALSQVAMVVAYGPSPTGSINSAMGRCRFMEIAAISVLIPLGLWTITPTRIRDTVMKAFVCFMVFLNVISVFQYMIPIFYL
jgi:hypothetical protein